MKINSIPISGYEGYYAVTDEGIVYSIQRKIEFGSGRTRQVIGKTLSQQKNSDGYFTVTLSKNDVRSKKYVHRLVAEAFIENPGNLPEVNHLDGNKQNNNAHNLAWVTHQQNMQHCYDTGLCKNKGCDHTFAVGVIDNTIGKEFATIKEWCTARGISYSTGRNLLSGHNTSKIIDLSAIVKQPKIRTND